MCAGKHTLAKAERLSHKRDIELLFKSGAKSVYSFPVRAVYRVPDDDGTGTTRHNAILVSVPKRHLKHAVDRNYAKRRLREAYRLNKAILEQLPPSLGGVYIALLWSDGHLHPFSEINVKVRNILHRIVESFNEGRTNE